MNFIKQSIPEVVIFKPKIFVDERGYFVETFRQDKLESAVGYRVNFCQDNESKSSQGVLRGLHFQLPPFAQSKLVRVIEGEVLDVAVDIRQGSLTYGQHVSAILNNINKYQHFIPRGFAHGFVVLSETAIFSYKVDNYYSPECDRGLAFDDPVLNIDWHLPLEQLKLSSKDQQQPGLVDIAAESAAFDYVKNLYE
ncbi:dTDP-4-dehydrorhamnose 3,5-epimerase [Thiomicrospira sp. R3]|uniref:dTDP-4-dehydrorhamnose 3,5-epimerase n=1 Tax=Thiomicrospira sp. R3 TaxID=3035472 RepID=UPI00259BB12E|nr:dTDP-4-dehydrorhamnose 3,5-epimerase [Thiomicrospira sp. R3]WFE68854.1 dTDP-4-dehydrorhamnose 3,5-epimerase [Thiomicrospira sp. R3]